MRTDPTFDEIEAFYHQTQDLIARATPVALRDGTKEAWEIQDALRRAAYDLNTALGYAARQEAEKR